MFFFLATADAEGRPDCSFKGGMPGFVRVTAPDELAFPDYDGNGMFKSLGNILANPAVGLLFIAMGERPTRAAGAGRGTALGRRPADRDFRRRAAPSAGEGTGDLPELPPVQPARRGAVGNLACTCITVRSRPGPFIAGPTRPETCGDVPLGRAGDNVGLMLHPEAARLARRAPVAGATNFGPSELHPLRDGATE